MVHEKTQVPDSFATHTAWRVDNVTNYSTSIILPHFCRNSTGFTLHRRKCEIELLGRWANMTDDFDCHLIEVYCFRKKSWRAHIWH